MSQLTHPRAPIFGLSGRLRLWLSIAAVALAAAVPTALVLSGDDSAQSSKATPSTYNARPDEGRYAVQYNSSFERAGQDTTDARP